MKPKLKVCYISPNAHLGGAEKVIETLILNHSHHIESHVVFCKNGPLIDLWRNQGIHTYLLPPFKLSHPVRYGFALKALNNYLKTHKIQIIHSHMSYGHILGGVAGYLSEIPEVWFQHGPIGGSIDRIASHISTDLLLINSEFLKQQQLKIRKIENIKVAYCPVNFPHISDVDKVKIKNQILEKYNWDNKCNILLHVGRMDPWKGQKEFLEIFRDLFSKNENFRALIYGDASIGSSKYLEELKQWVIENKLDEKVKFEGFSSDINEIYYSGDALIHTPTQPEPFGLAVAESMARGIPVVSWSEGGPRELIVNQDSGFISPPLDRVKILENILMLFSDGNLYKSISQKSALKIHDLEAIQWVQNIENFYSVILGNKPNNL